MNHTKVPYSNTFKAVIEIPLYAPIPIPARKAVEVIESVYHRFLMGFFSFVVQNRCSFCLPLVRWVMAVVVPRESPGTDHGAPRRQTEQYTADKQAKDRHHRHEDMRAESTAPGVVLACTLRCVRLSGPSCFWLPEMSPRLEAVGAWRGHRPRQRWLREHALADHPSASHTHALSP